MGSNIITEVGPSPNHLSRYFLTMIALRFFLLSKVASHKSQNKSRVRRERSIGDRWNISGVVIFGRCDLRSPTFTRNRTRIFACCCVFMTELLEDVFCSRDPPGRCPTTFYRDPSARLRFVNRSDVLCPPTSPSLSGQGSGVFDGRCYRCVHKICSNVVTHRCRFAVRAHRISVHGRSSEISMRRV